MLMYIHFCFFFLWVCNVSFRLLLFLLLFCFQVKSTSFHLKRFLFGDEKRPEEIKLKSSLHSLIVSIHYLSPRDYHRFHSPTDWTIERQIYIPGCTPSVSSPSDRHRAPPPLHAYLASLSFLSRFSCHLSMSFFLPSLFLSFFLFVLSFELPGFHNRSRECPVCVFCCTYSSLSVGLSSLSLYYSTVEEHITRLP